MKLLGILLSVCAVAVLLNVLLMFGKLIIGNWQFVVVLFMLAGCLVAAWKFGKLALPFLGRGLFGVVIAIGAVFVWIGEFLVSAFVWLGRFLVSLPRLIIMIPVWYFRSWSEVLWRRKPPRDRWS